MGGQGSGGCVCSVGGRKKTASGGKTKSKTSARNRTAIQKKMNKTGKITNAEFKSLGRVDSDGTHVVSFNDLFGPPTKQEKEARKKAQKVTRYNAKNAKKKRGSKYRAKLVRPKKK